MFITNLSFLTMSLVVLSTALTVSLFRNDAFVVLCSTVGLMSTRHKVWSPQIFLCFGFFL